MSKEEKGKGRPDRVGSLSDLGKLVGGAPQPAAARPAPGALLDPASVTSVNRAGRAPYSFVRLPDNVRWLHPEEAPPDLDVLNTDAQGKPLFHGSITFEMDALTDFYVRGMWLLEEFNALKEKDGKRPQPTLPYSVDGELRLPGSTLRGMIRALVEILGRAPLDPVEDQHLFFRAVAETAGDPQGISYRSRVRRQDENPDPHVYAGYLYGGRDQWRIRPAVYQGGRQWERIETREEWRRDKTGRVCSGPMPGKHRQWKINPVDPDESKEVEIPANDVLAYKAGGITQAIGDRGFDYGEKSEGEPCFYVVWTGPDGVRHVSFGHTHYFRLPYRNTVGKAVPPGLRREKTEKRWDLAQAIFGRAPRVHEDKEGVTEIAGRRGRVCFEDALLVSAPPQAVDPQVRSAILSQPKPTTFQHYLVQRSDRLADSIHWDGDKDGRGQPVVRGHKLYWHRPIALREAESGADQDGDKSRVTSRFQPARRGARFRARVRFENLRDWELGALLSAIQLEKGCAHHLGLAKPLGLGSFRIQVTGMDIVAPRERYGSFFEAVQDGCDPSLCTGAVNRLKDLTGYQKAFAKWLLEDKDADQGKLWSSPRMKELKAILTFDGLPENWASITRHLEFGKVPGRQRPEDYNEYRKVGYPQRIETQPRRPLPPATQVIEAGPHIPRDPQPPFLPPERPGSGRRFRR